MNCANTNGKMKCIESHFLVMIFIDVSDISSFRLRRARLSQKIFVPKNDFVRLAVLIFGKFRNTIIPSVPALLAKQR